MPGGQLIYAGVNMALHALVVQLSIQKHILTRLSSPKSASTAQAASLIHRRGLAGGGGNLSFPFLSLLHAWLLRKNSGEKKIKRK
jgi:hypothetical protein